MSFTIELNKKGSETSPKNLEQLVDWVRVGLKPYNSLCEYIAEIHIDKPISYEIVEELRQLEIDHEVSLQNSNRRISGEKHIVMCSTLSFIYERACRSLDKKLSETSRKVAKGNFELHDIGNTLVAGSGYKRSIHSYESLERSGSLDCSCTDKWDNKYLTYREIFHELRTLTEQAANAATVG